MICRQQVTVSYWPKLDHVRSQSLPPQSHTFSNKATPTPTRPHLLIVPLCRSQALKHWVYEGPHLFKPQWLLHRDEKRWNLFSFILFYFTYKAGSVKLCVCVCVCVCVCLLKSLPTHTHLKSMNRACFLLSLDFPFFISSVHVTDNP
jgi:hypothetical protein